MHSTLDAKGILLAATINLLITGPQKGLLRLESQVIRRVRDGHGVLANGDLEEQFNNVDIELTAAEPIS